MLVNDLVKESRAGLKRRNERGLFVIVIYNTLVNVHALFRFAKRTRGSKEAHDSDSSLVMSSDLESTLSWVRVASWLCNGKREKQQAGIRNIVSSEELEDKHI